MNSILHLEKILPFLMILIEPPFFLSSLSQTRVLFPDEPLFASLFSLLGMPFSTCSIPVYPSEPRMNITFSDFL